MVTTNYRPRKTTLHPKSIPSWQFEEDEREEAELADAIMKFIK